MDFIPELPRTKSGHDNILVIVDRLTKFVVLIPTTIGIDSKGTAELVFKHIICKFGLPREIVSDRDSKWTSSFWEEVCRQMNIKRAMSTSYHPQTDGQTEIMNQILEIALRCYVNPQKDDWDTYLDGFSLSYNNTPHSATTYAPAFLLYGFIPTTGSNILRDPSSDLKRTNSVSEHEALRGGQELIGDFDADRFVSELEGLRISAQDALSRSQAYQRHAYNKGRLKVEFEKGDLVVINLKNLRLQDHQQALGKKLNQRYDGPFEIMEKISPVAYRLRLPSSYGMHNVLNITHLERYQLSPTELGPRTDRDKQRQGKAAIEWEIDGIIAETRRKRGQRRVPYYRVRYAGFGPEHDEWIPRSWLRNAPSILRDWDQRHQEGGDRREEPTQDL